MDFEFGYWNEHHPHPSFSYIIVLYYWQSLCRQREESELAIVDVLADWEGMVMVPIPTLAKNVIFITYPQSPNLLGLIKKRIVHVIL
jgi:hypothetical protein